MRIVEARPAPENSLHAFLLDALPGIGLSASNGLETAWRSGAAEASRLADAVSRFTGLPRADPETLSKLPAAFHDLSRRFLKEEFLYPFQEDGRTCLALADPTASEALKAVELALGERPKLCIASFEEIERLFERAGEAGGGAALVPFAAPDADAASDDTAETLQDLARGAPVVRLIDQLLERAVDLGATDLHLETERDQLRVRYRVDGYLRADQKLPVSLAPAVISRIKILASLDIAERRLPQDGRANLRIGTVEADLRVAVMPTMYGETAVLRILVKDARLLEFTRIGMRAGDQRAFEALLNEPNGIVIVTGPTGSGKTTTLATAISLLNQPSRKIVTVEDPIEYQIPGVHQTQIKPAIGLTFASALRSFLRHDPDVIMVGEMRDRETAGIGIQAALTGHLVMTTLHTNSAADAVIRLKDMGVEPYLIGASLRGVLGQRLVRRLCPQCRRPDPALRDTAGALAASRGIAIAPDAVFCAPKGCEACGHTGYRGRIGIFEVLRTNDALRALVRQGADTAAIVGAAREAGMTPMVEDGLGKCAEGLTSIEEVLRATG